MLPMKLRIAVATVAGSAILSSCASAPERPGTADFGHIHDLSFESASDSLFIATHAGVYVLANGDVEGPLGDNRHDFMSFAMAPDGMMIGGGHPDSSAGWGNHMGFVVSADRGEEWESLSLTGQVDFHDIEFAGDGYVGYDSQTGVLAYSGDGVEWESRNTLALYDLAVSPDESETWIATTPDGMLVSVDGGANFGVFVDAPAETVYLDWSDAQGLWGITASGELVVSQDVGATWETAGTAPAVGVFEVTPDGTVYLATEASVYVSDDRGATWGDALSVSE